MVYSFRDKKKSRQREYRIQMSHVVVEARNDLIDNDPFFGAPKDSELKKSHGGSVFLGMPALQSKRTADDMDSHGCCG